MVGILFGHTMVPNSILLEKLHSCQKIIDDLAIIFARL